jgi:hypothetical protein
VSRAYADVNNWPPIGAEEQDDGDGTEQVDNSGVTAEQ